MGSLPAAAIAKVIDGSLVAPPSFPEIELSFSSTGGERAVGGRDAAGRVFATTDDLSVVALRNQDELQVVGSTDRTDGVVVLNVEHRLRCPGAIAVTLTQSADGVALEIRDESGGKRSVAWISKPWAVDAGGRDVPTWFEVDGTTLRQFIDTWGAQAPIAFDPTYSYLNCGDFQATRDAETYLNMQNDGDRVCPIMGMFFASRGYRPKFGYETNVYREYGLVAVNEFGQCTWSPDTSTYFDFQVPCRAHDYCYDLRRAGFSATVSDEGCDIAFGKLMDAHCTHRGPLLILGCAEASAIYQAVVSTPEFVVADPEPFYARIQNSATFYCLNVEGAAGVSAVLIQYGCIDTPNGRFRIEPPPLMAFLRVRQ